MPIVQSTPCKHCGDTNRYTSTKGGTCVTCQKKRCHEYQVGKGQKIHAKIRKKYRNAHPERVLDYYQENRTKILEWHRLVREQNLEKYKARERAQYHKNKAKKNVDSTK